MTSAEVKEVMETPIEQIEQYTKEVELKDYFEENPTSPLSEIIELVNTDIEQNSQPTEANIPYKSKKRRKTNYTE